MKKSTNSKESKVVMLDRPTAFARTSASFWSMRATRSSGAAHPRTFLAVPAGWDQARSESPEQACSASCTREVGLKPGARAHHRPDARTGCGTRCRALGASCDGATLSRTEADLVPAAPGGARLDVRLRASTHPEFDAWRWSTIAPLAVIEFKRHSWSLIELARILFRSRRRRGCRTAIDQFEPEPAPTGAGGVGERAEHGLRDAMRK